MNRAIISDILLWVALTMLMAYGIYMLAVVIPANRGQTIVLTFQNANEISKGSGVKMMGMDIGFVDNVQLKRDHVEITVQTYPDALEIPSGSTFTILFTGLAGAKSIEVELPTSPQPDIHGKPFYRVEEPIRMADTLASGIKSTQALQQGAENITDFFGKKKPVEELQHNIQQAHEVTVAAVRQVEGIHDTVQHIQQEMTENTRSATATITDIQNGTRQVVAATEPRVLRPKVDNTLQMVQDVSQLIQVQRQTTAQGVTLQTRLTQLNRQNSKLASGMQALQVRVTQYPLNSWLGSFAQGSDAMLKALDQASQWFARDHLPALQQARVSIQQFNRQLETVNVKVGRALQQKKTKANPKQP